MQNNKKVSTDLGTENIFKLILKYSIPAVVGTIVMSLYNIVDRIFIGQGVGPLAIAGLALTFPFMIMLMAFGMLVGAGSAARISITLGQGDKQKAEKIVGNAFTLTLLISGTVILISFIFMNDLLQMFGGTEATIKYAQDFMKIIIPGGIFSTINFGFNNIMRASGHPKKAMTTMIMSSVINAILAPIFIFGFHGGIEGAAWATVISYLIGAIWVMSHFLGNNSELKLLLANLKLEKDVVISIINIGMSPFTMQLVMSMVIILINKTLIHYGGDIAIGAFGITNSINTLVIMLIVGLNQGTQPIIGFNYGAKNYERMYTTVKYGAIIATGLSMVGFTIGTFLPMEIASLFTKDIQLRNTACEALRISVIMFPIVGIQFIISNFFQSIGKAKLSIFLSLTRQFLFLIPCIIFLPKFFGLTGAWCSMPTADGLSTIVAIITYFVYVKKFKATVELQTANTEA